VISKYRGDGVVRWVSVAEKELDRNQEELPKDRAADVYKIPFFQGRKYGTTPTATYTFTPSHSQGKRAMAPP
jgi:hypothetical protein